MGSHGRPRHLSERRRLKSNQQAPPTETAKPKMTEVKNAKQISDVVWEIPISFKAGMNVPARIYATKKLLESMDSGVIEQVTNVASLPGIVRYSYAMADAHWGYGFPIGGVAAFDPENGIISPGGIGFDINCLHPDSTICDENGVWRRIGGLEVGSQGFLTFDEASRSTISTKATMKQQRWEAESILKLMTRGGKTLIVNLPGSPNGVKEGLAVLNQFVDHAVDLITGTRVAHG